MKKQLLPVILICILSLSFVKAFGQKKTFTKEEMKQDIDALFSTLEKVHPDLYFFYPKQSLQKDIETLKSGLESEGDMFYFWRQVTPLIVKLGDGHTNIFPPFYGPKDFENVFLFPYALKITYPENEIFTKNEYANIPEGAQIVTINNRKAEDILLQMMNYSSGEKDFFRSSKLEMLFSPILSILYGDSIYNITYKLNDEIKSEQVKGVSFLEYPKIISAQKSVTTSDPYSFRTLPGSNTGIIEFNQFVNLDKFKVFLDSTFTTLKNDNIGNLIIDIRENGGGNSALGDELFQYISPVPFAQFGKTIIKYSDEMKQIYKDQTEPNGSKVYDDISMNELRDNPLRYTGKVYLLISNHTFSSAASFSWAFKHFNMGTVVGEETGGIAVSFGDMISLKLPNTGLVYSSSHKKFYRYGATDENNHGTLPDYKVDADKALDYAIELIAGGK